MADVPHQFSPQVGDGGEDAACDDVTLDLGEPQLDLVEPGRVSRREVAGGPRGADPRTR